MWMADAVARQSTGDNSPLMITDLQQLLRETVTINATDIISSTVQSINGAVLNSTRAIIAI